MKEINLGVLEMNKYIIIKNLVDHNGNKKNAALKLGLTIRQINRLIIVYKTKGKAGFHHGNNGKKNKRAINDDICKLITDLYKTKYEGFNIQHFNEKLESIENIKVSYNFVYTLLRKNSLLSPKVHKITVKNEKKKLALLLKEKKKLSEEQKDLIVVNNILDVHDAHSRVPRLKYFGECLEMDASKDYWFGDSKTTLHGAIDNSTGTICGLYFDKEETLNGYYHLFERIWRKFGVPAKFKTDNRTVFEYAGLKGKTVGKDTLTQFGYACSQLGVEIETTSIPEEKSRIERLWETLQSRLKSELKLAGINEIDEANKFLITYIDEFNKGFALPINYNTSVFENVDINLINNTLAIIDQRVFDSGCSIRYKNKIYCAYRNDKQINYRKGTKCLVIETYDGKLLCNVDNQLSVLCELPEHQKHSKDFDLNIPKEKKEKTPYIPPLTHPWKQESFMNYLSKLPKKKANAYL